MPAAARAADRPAPATPRRNGIALLLLGSLTVHVGVVAAFNSVPQPLPSAGIPAISVDIVLGDNAAAGLGTVGREGATEVKPTDAAPIDSPDAAPRPVAREAVTEAAPVVAADAAAEDTASAVPAPVLAALAETEASEESLPLPAASPTPPPEQPVAVSVPPEQGPDIAPTPREPERTERESSEIAAKPVRDVTPRRLAAQASPAAGGVGRGGSAVDAGYQGRVAAHLARHKRFPASARRRRQHGSVGIDFAIDGRGRVTMVRIARSSGFVRLDRAAEAMVWRASPFPAPPDRRPQRFSVPISYSIR